MSGDGCRATKDIPAAVRKAVLERDGNTCRLCGRWYEILDLHHLVFRSQGGLHAIANLVALCHHCHLTKAHGFEASLWRELLFDVIQQPGRTALQLRRWRQPKEQL